MKKYLEVFRVYFRTQIVWRFDVAMNAAFALVKVLLAFILWRAIFSGREVVAGYTFPQMLTYYICVSYLLQLDLSGSMASEIGERIKGGTFSGRMVTPINIKGYFYAQTLGAAAFQLMLVALSACVCLPAFGRYLAFAPEPGAIISALMLFIMGMAFMLQMHFALGIMAFKYTEVWVFLMIKNNILAVISGSIIPLSLLPGAIVSALKYLPFYYAAYLPGQLLIGKGAGEAAMGLCVLAAWNIVMWTINHFAYARLRTRYDGVGI